MDDQSNLRSIAIQIFITIISSVIITYVSGMLMIRSLFNAIWIFGIPVFIGIYFNRGVGRQLVMTFVLMTLSALSLMFVAEYFGLGV